MAKNKHNIFMKVCKKYFVVLLNNVVVRVEKEFFILAVLNVLKHESSLLTRRLLASLRPCVYWCCSLLPSVPVPLPVEKRRIYTVLEMEKFILYPFQCLILSIFLIELVQSFKKEVCLSLVYFCPYFVISFDLWIIRILLSRS